MKKSNKIKYYLFEGNSLASKDNLLVYKLSDLGNNKIEASLVGVQDPTTKGQFRSPNRNEPPSYWPSENIFKTIHYGWIIKEITEEEAFELLL
ncbi:unnamed protein product [marine sediment metagenome]|uniref:Uncharacterized protein n=1 Tax=marine sediment metagenome TaxID=412755 RepID=X0Z1V8_9ZZZZ